jgi:hypothetical protein
MTTRQHLIEQDCLDKLGWDLVRVANATEDEMIRSLTHFETQHTVSPAMSPSRPVDTSWNSTPTPSIGTLDLSAISVFAPSSPTIPPRTKTTESHIVIRLRESIRLKTLCVSADDILTEDYMRVKASLDRDEQCLKTELDAIRDEIDVYRISEAKRSKIQQVLQKVIQSVGGQEDRLHLQEVDSHLIQLKERIHSLNALLE